MKVLNDLDVHGRLLLTGRTGTSDDLITDSKNYPFAVVVGTNVDQDDAFTYQLSDKTTIPYSAGDATETILLKALVEDHKELKKDFEDMMGAEVSQITSAIDTFNEVERFLQGYNSSDLQSILNGFVRKNATNDVDSGFALSSNGHTFLTSKLLHLTANGDSKIILPDTYDNDTDSANSLNWTIKGHYNKSAGSTFTIDNEQSTLTIGSTLIYDYGGNKFTMIPSEGYIENSNGLHIGKDYVTTDYILSTHVSNIADGPIKFGAGLTRNCVFEVETTSLHLVKILGDVSDYKIALTTSNTNAHGMPYAAKKAKSLIRLTSNMILSADINESSSISDSFSISIVEELNKETNKPAPVSDFVVTGGKMSLMSKMMLSTNIGSDNVDDSDKSEITLNVGTGNNSVPPYISVLDKNGHSHLMVFDGSYLILSSAKDTSVKNAVGDMNVYCGDITAKDIYSDSCYVSGVHVIDVQQNSLQDSLGNNGKTIYLGVGNANIRLENDPTGSANSIYFSTGDDTVAMSIKSDGYIYLFDGQLKLTQRGDGNLYVNDKPMLTRDDLVSGRTSFTPSASELSLSIVHKYGEFPRVCVYEYDSNANKNRLVYPEVYTLANDVDDNNFTLTIEFTESSIGKTYHIIYGY